MRRLLALALFLSACTGQEDGGPADAEPLDAPDSGCVIELADTRFAVELEEPQLTLPATSGVGTRVLSIQRGAREVRAQLFYPTDATEGRRAPIMDDATAAELVARHGLPTGFHRSIQTNALFDVPIASGPWPVLIYSHGLGTFTYENHILFEDLVSQGWVVVALSHPTELPPAPAPFAPLSEWVAFFEAYADQLSNHWVPDVRAALDALEPMNTERCGWLEGSLDFTRVGFFGWSFGGATAMEACHQDDRCRAAVNMDGTLFGDRSYAPSKPQMMLMLLRDESTWDQVHARATGVVYTARIRDAVHYNFTNTPLILETYLPGFDWELAGIDGALGEERPRQLARDYVSAFFDLHLREGPAGLLDETPPAEVLLEKTTAGRNQAELTLFGSLFAGDGLAGAAVSFGSSRASSDGEGRWRLDQIPQDTSLVVLVDHPAIYPVAMPWSTGGLFAHLGNRSLAGPTAIADLAAEAGVAVENGRGHLVLILLHAEDGLQLFPGQGGVSLSAAGDGPFYLGENGIEPSLTATEDGIGIVFYFNLEEGAHAVQVTHPSLDCRAITGPPLGLPGMIDTAVLPDRVSLMTVACQP